MALRVRAPHCHRREFARLLSQINDGIGAFVPSYTTTSSTVPEALKSSSSTSSILSVLPGCLTKSPTLREKMPAPRGSHRANERAGEGRTQCCACVKQTGLSCDQNESELTNCGVHEVGVVFGLDVHEIGRLAVQVERKSLAELRGVASVLDRARVLLLACNRRQQSAAE